MVEPLPEFAPMLAAAQAAPSPDLSMPTAELRALSDAGVMAMHAFVRPAGPTTTTDAKVGDVPVRIYRPEGVTSPAPVHIHVHGGGWFMGSIETADPMARELASAGGMVVVSVGYRLAPEHRWPTAPEDVYAVLQWVHDDAAVLGVDSTSISIGGESAGGNLAACVALMTRDRHGPPLVAQWLDVPGVDLTVPDTESQLAYGKGYGLDMDLVRQCLDWYAYADERRNPYASPALATDLEGLAPAIVTTAEFDPLRDQGEVYAARLEAAGVPVILRRSAGHLHATTWLTGFTPSAAEWHDEMVAALRDLHARATVAR
jgi:acetyl esterase